MARLWTAGAETRSIGTNTATQTPDGFASGAITIDTTTFRSGSAAFAVPAATNTQLIGPLAAPSATTYFFRAYIRAAAAPAGNAYMMCPVVPSSTTNDPQIVMTSSGTVALFVTLAQQGSTSANICDSTWHRIEMSYTLVGTNWTAAELRVDGSVIATWTGTQALGSNTGPRIGLGGGGSTFVYNVDDIALNDSSGASQNTYPGDGKVVLLKPISLNLNGGSWTDSGALTTSAALTDAIDNTPPIGIADTTANAGKQDRNAAANSSLDMNLTTYATAGIVTGDTINVLSPFCNTGAPVVTQAKTGSIGITTNPTIANIAFTKGATAAANFWQGVAAGTYPTGWKWEQGTTTYAPTVTLSSSPVARITITGGTTTRIAMVDAVGMYVDYTPAAGRVPRSPGIDSGFGHS